MGTSSLQKRDQLFGFSAGLLIGLLFLPVFKTARPDLYEKLFMAIVPFFFIATPLGLYIAKLISQKISFIWQVAKFGVIGVLNTFVDLGILSLLTIAIRSSYGIDSKITIFESALITITFYSIYKAISFIIANINSYYWNKYWTFEQNAEKKSSTEFLQFFIVSIVGFLLNVFVASAVFTITPPDGLTSDQWGLIGALTGTGAGLVWNFLGYKFIVFKK